MNDVEANAWKERFALDVALGTAQDQVRNVVVLTGLDIDVPVPSDPVAAPLHDTLLRLEGADGTARELEVGGPDVGRNAQNGTYTYRFRAVPAGLYNVSMKLPIDDVWATIVSGLLVSKKGASIGGKRLQAAKPKPPPPPAPAAEEDDDGEEMEACILDGVADHVLPGSGR